MGEFGCCDQKGYQKTPADAMRLRGPPQEICRQGDDAISGAAADLDSRGIGRLKSDYGRGAQVRPAANSSGDGGDSFAGR